MNIALLQTPTAPLNLDVHGGLERVELAELDFLSRAGHSVVLNAAVVVGKKTGVRAIGGFGRKNRVLKYLYYLVFALRNRKADIFHGHYTPILALLFPDKALVHFHGLAVAELPLYRYPPCRKRYHQAHYVFCSQWIRDKFHDRYPAIPETHLHVLYNGADIEAIVPGVRGGCDKDPVNICFYCGWIPEKGIYEVLQVAELLWRKRTDFKIWYGGSAYGHYRDSKWGNADEIDRKVRSFAERLPCIKLTGTILPGDLPAFLGRMDLGLVPSIYPDPFPLVPLEMMAAGLPVIAYALGGLLESVVDGRTGFLVENKRPDLLAGRIEWFLDNRDQLKAFGQNARAHAVENFSWGRHAEQLAAIYRSMRKGTA